MAERVIFHADCNNFYASVELLHFPELKDKPVAVAGSEDNRHGIILAKNEAAKKYKVQTAETVWQAKRKCPGLILLPPHHSEYSRYSKIVNGIYAAYTDRVEPFGIDESWLDMSGSWRLFGKSPMDVANRLRREIKEKTGLSISVGVSFNKVFAKLGSDYKKPDAATEICKANYKELLWPLPVQAMLMVGGKARESLAEIGVNTIGQLAGSDPALLQQVLGKLGPQLAAYARGEDTAPVALIGEHEQPKSIGNGLTFKRNLLGYKDVRTGVGSLADEVATRLRNHHLYASSVQVLIKNPDLKNITRQKPLPYATNLAKDITDTAMQLVQDNWDLAKPIRMLTVTAQQLTPTPFATQINMFEEAPAAIDPKREKLEHSIDGIRSRFGHTAILAAGELHNDIGVDGRASIKEKEEKKEE